MADISISSNTGITGNIVAFTQLGKGLTQRRMAAFAFVSASAISPFEEMAQPGLGARTDQILLKGRQIALHAVTPA